jgi:hypothetical protein
VKDRAEFAISERQLTSTWLRDDRWDDPDHREVGVSICKFTLVVHDGRLREHWAPLVSISLHALARRIDDRPSATTLRYSATWLRWPMQTKPARRCRRPMVFGSARWSRLASASGRHGYVMSGRGSRTEGNTMLSREEMRIAKLVRELDQQRQATRKAEQQARALRALIAKMRLQQAKATEAKEQRVA